MNGVRTLAMIMFVSLITAIAAVSFSLSTGQGRYEVTGNASLCLNSIKSQKNLDDISILVAPTAYIPKWDVHLDYWPIISRTRTIDIGLMRHFTFVSNVGTYRVWMIVNQAVSGHLADMLFPFGAPDQATGVFTVSNNGENRLPISLSCATLDAWRQLVVSPPPAALAISNGNGGVRVP